MLIRLLVRYRKTDEGMDTMRLTLRMKKWLVLSAAVMMMFLASSALADGNALWVKSRLNGYVRLASYVGDYNGYTGIDDLGGVTIPEQGCVQIISKNASVWEQPRTNSKKLGTVQNGEILQGSPAGTGLSGSIVMQDGFYAVLYKNSVGWVNSAYCVLAPYEITLMESNVPAYCAPDARAKKVGSLSKLTKYTVIGFYDDFYIVNLRQAAAFIPMSVAHYDTHFERLYHAGFHTKLTVNKKTALRTGPGEGYAKVKDVKSGQTYDCVDEVDGWYLVTDGDAGGYTYIWSGDASAENW